MSTPTRGPQKRCAKTTVSHYAQLVSVRPPKNLTKTVVVVFCLGFARHTAQHSCCCSRLFPCSVVDCPSTIGFPNINTGNTWPRVVLARTFCSSGSAFSCSHPANLKWDIWFPRWGDQKQTLVARETGDYPRVLWTRNWIGARKLGKNWTSLTRPQGSRGARTIKHCKGFGRTKTTCYTEFDSGHVLTHAVVDLFKCNVYVVLYRSASLVPQALPQSRPRCSNGAADLGGGQGKFKDDLYQHKNCTLVWGWVNR